MVVSRAGVGRMWMPRSRGAVTGVLLVILGVWGALIPFIGPYFDWSYGPGPAWTWTAARGWLEVYPGLATVVGGVLLLVSANRVSATLGGWLALLAGGWFVVGRAFAPTLQLPAVGQPLAATDAKRALLEVSYFTGLGVVIVFLAGVALTRLSMRVVGAVAPASAGATVTTTDALPAPEYAAGAASATPPPPPEPERFSGGLFHRRHTSVGR